MVIRKKQQGFKLMSKQALIVRWNNVIWGFNAKPAGISVHKDLSAAHQFIERNAFGLGHAFEAPDKRLALIEVGAKTPLARLFELKESVRFQDGADDFAYRQALAVVPSDYQRLDYEAIGLAGIAQAVANSHEHLYRKGKYRSEPNWGAFAL